MVLPHACTVTSKSARWAAKTDTVRVDDADCPGLILTVPGLKPALLSNGAPVAVKWTDPEKRLFAVTVTGVDPEWPRRTLIVDAALTVNSGVCAKETTRVEAGTTRWPWPTARPVKG